jgi:CubicO group peptidase (beta-lactamase class C family)
MQRWCDHRRGVARAARALWRCVLALGLALLGAAAQAEPPYPDPEWPELAKTDAAAQQALLARPACRAFEATFFGDAGSGKRLLTDGLVVIRDGVLAYERYDPAYGPEIKHPLWSAAKSVIVTLVGIAVRQGRLSLDDKLERFFPYRDLQLANDPNGHLYASITVRDLVQMTAGFLWDEDYEDLQHSSVIAMLYWDGYRDMAGYALRRPLGPDGPGRHFLYNSGVSNILAAILAKVYADQKDRFPWTQLFDRLGMRGVVFQRDDAGTFIGSSYVLATPRDMARLGYLYLTGGRWKGEQLLPEGWAEFVRTMPAAIGAATAAAEQDYIRKEGLYGAGFWVNGQPGWMSQPYYLHAPADFYYASGHYGQLIFVLPTQRLVVARTGWDATYDDRVDAMVASVVGCFGAVP